LAARQDRSDEVGGGKEMDLSQFDYVPLVLSFAHVVLGVIVLILAKFALAALSPYSTDRETTARDNPAFGLAIAGYYAAVVFIYVAAAGAAPLPMDAGTRAVMAAMAADVAWAVAGILALNLSRWTLDRLLVSGIRNDREIADRQNLAAGVLESGGYIASGMILGGAIRQPGGTIWTTLALFVLGQCALVLMGHLYQRWTGYIASEIRAGNFAAGIAFAMTLVALALLMLKALSGEFVSWPVNLSFFAFDAVAGLLLLMLLRWVSDAALLPNARIAEEIVRDRNVNVGLIEGVLAVGIAALILFLF
jgi:uncharacterized membrane protein YjfL (UPF0719 family)